MMKVVGDYLVIADAYDSLRLSTIDLSRRGVRQTLARGGDGPGTIRTPWFMFTESVSPPKIWLFDVTKRVFTLWDASGRRQGMLAEVPLRMRVGVAARPLLVPGGVIAEDLFEEATLALGGNSDPSIRERVGTPPFAVSDFPEDTVAHMSANEFYLVADPSRERVAILYKHVNRVDFFDIKTRRIIVAEGSNRLPVPRIGAGGAWQDLADAYVNGQDATARYVYALYCGCSAEEKRRGRAATTVRVFDWTGKMVAEVRLDRVVTSVAVSANDSILYGAMQAPLPLIGEWNLPAELRGR